MYSNGVPSAFFCVPVCEALADAFISDEDILKLKDLPIWFTHAKTDPVVVPDDFVVPT